MLLHTAGFIGILGLLLLQIPKPQKRIPGGAMHSALLALVAGIALVGIRTSLHATDPGTWEAVNNGKVGVKFLILAVILVLGYKNVKKPSVSVRIWAILIALTVLNIVVATAI